MSLRENVSYKKKCGFNPRAFDRGNHQLLEFSANALPVNFEQNGAPDSKQRAFKELSTTVTPGGHSSMMRRIDRQVDVPVTRSLSNIDAASLNGYDPTTASLSKTGSSHICQDGASRPRGESI